MADGAPLAFGFLKAVLGPRSRPSRARILALVMTGVATAFLLAATAAAARTVTHPASFRFEAQLPANRGHSAYLRAVGHHEIELDLANEGLEGSYVTASYKTKGWVSQHGIFADFGRFGRVELHFAHPPKRSLFKHPNCHPSTPSVNSYGEMVGSAEFAALGGFVTVKSSHLRVEGKTWSEPRRTCTPRPRNVVFEEGVGPEVPEPLPRLNPHETKGEREGEGPAATVMARGHAGGRTVDVYAIKLNREFVVDMAATSTRRFGRVLVATSVHAPHEESGPGEAVEFVVHGEGPRPPAASLGAAAPFSGTATYRRGAGSASWLGSLAARIPGEGTVALAGPGFKAALCAYAGRKAERACERPVAPPHEA